MDDKASFSTSHDLSIEGSDEDVVRAPGAGATIGQKADISDVIDASNDAVVNPTQNRDFDDVVAARISRRGVLAGGLGLAAGAFFGPETSNADSLSPASHGRTEIGFSPVSVEQYLADSVIGGEAGKMPVVSDDYSYDVLIPWGTPIDSASGVAEYAGDPSTRPTSAEQEQMVGLGHDGMWYFPSEYNMRRHGDFHRYARRYRGRSNEGMLCINHEFGTNPHAIGKPFPESSEDVRLSQAVHGCSVVKIKRADDGKWRPMSSAKSRRVTVNTPVEYSGPVAEAADRFLANEAGNPYQGTVNNCANGYTPWGTYLTCEENFNGYFGTKPTLAADGSVVFDDLSYDAGEEALAASDDRYGFSSSGFGYGWQAFDDRFDLNNRHYRNERNRFGWVVEIDPFTGEQMPVKRTALGRVKHEGVAVTVGKGGRVVCYMGDDQRFDYIYKFVSKDHWRRMFKNGIHPLDEGTLYAAKFNDDGTGDWLELSMDNPDIAASGQFADLAEILVYTREAADIAGATPMNRPEWTTVAPNGEVYCTLTNNSELTEESANAANPLRTASDGHIVKWRDANRHTGTTFQWDIFVVAADVQEENLDLADSDDVETFSDPDGLWADPDGRLFIQTDGGQQKDLNDQMLVADSRTGELRRIFVGVNSDEITGIAVTPDRRTMFVNIQHPGNGDPTSTNFPARDENGAFANDGVTIPRDCTIVITKKDGGVIGS